MLKDLVLKNRSYRGFDESVRISRETLEGFVDCARLCPSSVNKQPLKYFSGVGAGRSGEGAGTDKVGAGAAGYGTAASGKTADGFCCDLPG